jgi:GT2 family glycosyltransferase
VTLVEASACSASSGVIDLDAGAPLPSIDDIPALGARCLVRLAGRPVGTIDLPGTSAHLSADGLARVIEDALGASLAVRGRAAGAVRSGPLTAAGLGVEVPQPSTTVADDLTVVIATRDRPDTLVRCVEGILAGVPAPASIVIVDSAPSDDRTARAVADRWSGDPRVRYLLEPNPGLGRAHDVALPLVGTELVAFTDDDVVVDPGWVGALVDAFASGPDVTCVTGLIAPLELRTREQWWVELGSGFGKGFERRARSLARTLDESALFPYDAGTLGSGANMAFRTEALRAIGGFDRSLGTGTGSLGGDDLAALHAVVVAGGTLLYEPGAIVFHRHHADLAALERQAYGYGAGLTAYLAAAVARRPRSLLEIAQRSVSGAARVLRPTSTLNARRPSDYPDALVRRERRGMLAGPGRYVRQRLRDRRLDGPRAKRHETCGSSR